MTQIKFLIQIFFKTRRNGMLDCAIRFACLLNCTAIYFQIGKYIELEHKTLTVAGSTVQVISVIRVVTVITTQVTDPLYLVLIRPVSGVWCL